VSNSSAISWRKQVTFQWDDVDTSSLKEQSVGGHVTPLSHIILMTEWSDMSTHRLLFQWIRIIWLSGVTCPPTDCCLVQSVGGHVTPLSHIILIHWNNSLWVDMSLHSVILSWFTERTVCGWTCHSTQSYYPDSLKQQSVGGHVTTNKHNCIKVYR
jgi:hypothetical protein